jgi:hypothetical protein
MKVEIAGCGYRPCRWMNWHKNRTQKSLIAAFCCLVFLQLPTDQRDMAEACGSRICDATSTIVSVYAGVAHYALSPISMFQ